MGKCVLVNVGQFILGQVPMRKKRNWLLWTENHDGCMQYQGVTWYHLLHSTTEDEIQPTKTNLQIPQKKKCSPVKGRTFFNLADAIVVQIAGSEIKKILKNYYTLNRSITELNCANTLNIIGWHVHEKELLLCKIANCSTISFTFTPQNPCP